MWETPETPFPLKSIEEIQRVQSDRKRLAVERAKGSAFFAGRLDHLNLNQLDDPTAVCISWFILTPAVLRAAYDSGLSTPTESFVRFGLAPLLPAAR